MTNGDHIRSMDNEQLASWLAFVFTCDNCPMMNSCETKPNENCNEQIHEWLERSITQKVRQH